MPSAHHRDPRRGGRGGAGAPSCVGRAAQPSEPGALRKPHVVLLVLDEFPGDSLLDERGQIDPVRYPNFAALAARLGLVSQRLLVL